MNNPFEIQGQNEIRGIDITQEFLENISNCQQRIEKVIASAPVVLFMKGNSVMPQCGFSANSSAILAHCGCTFHTYNILNDPDLRAQLKEFSNWPTFPQLYINGEFIGGNDILTEMFEQGELQKLLS